MAEDKSPEEGFKFVDKRGGAQEAAADVAVETLEDVEQPLEASESDELEGLDEDEGGSFPGMDGVVGIASYAVGLLSMSSWQYLGLVADQKTGKAHRDLKQARIAIDCVAGMVDALDKAGDAVDAKMMTDLKRVLNDLRLNFVTQSNMAKDAG